jgi:hypothetical protein
MFRDVQMEEVSRLRNRLRAPPSSLTDYSELLHTILPFPHMSTKHHTAVLFVPAL